MSKCLSLVLISSIALALGCGQAHARIYKWVDENGVVQYTQYPPPNGESEEIATTSRPTVSPAKQRKDLQERVEALNKQRAEEQQAEQDAADQDAKQAKLKERCDRIRTNLEILSKNSRVVEEAEDGSRSFLTEEQRQQRITNGNQQLSEFCQGV